MSHSCFRCSSPLDHHAISGRCLGCYVKDLKEIVDKIESLSKDQAEKLQTVQRGLEQLQSSPGIATR